MNVWKTMISFTCNILKKKCQIKTGLLCLFVRYPAIINMVNVM